MHDVAILGLYFPPWLVCLLLASGGAWIANAVLRRTPVSVYVGNWPILFGGLTVIFAVGIWALFFKS